MVSVQELRPQLECSYGRSGTVRTKNSKGFYLYDEKGKQGELNEAALKLLPQEKKTLLKLKFK